MLTEPDADSEPPRRDPSESPLLSQSRETFYEIFDVRSMPDAAILDPMSLDFRGPYDELTELRSLLTTQEIAELTGLRRETISRARPDSHFQRRTEKALRDLYVVVERMRAVGGGDVMQLGAVLRRPQGALGDRSIADLLREGKADVVLEQLAAPEPAGLAPAEPAAAPQPPVAKPRRGRSREDAVEAFLAADPEVAALLPEIEAKVRKHFAPAQWVERGSSWNTRARRTTSFGAGPQRPVLRPERRPADGVPGAGADLLRPVRSRLNVGFL